MMLFGYPYNNDWVICKDSSDYLVLDKHCCKMRQCSNILINENGTHFFDV